MRRFVQLAASADGTEHNCGSASSQHSAKAFRVTRLPSLQLAPRVSASILEKTMGALAPQVCVEEPDIQRLVALIGQLPAHGHVKLHMRDGSVCEGVVRTRPNVQVFRDPAKTEGINVSLSLAACAAPSQIQRVWLDQVVRVEHLDSTLGSEN